MVGNFSQKLTKHVAVSTRRIVTGLFRLDIDVAFKLAVGGFLTDGDEVLPPRKVLPIAVFEERLKQKIV